MDENVVISRAVARFNSSRFVRFEARNCHYSYKLPLGAILTKTIV